jgi:hypothetical protein
MSRVSPDRSKATSNGRVNKQPDSHDLAMKGHFSLIAGMASRNSPSRRKLRRFRRNFRKGGSEPQRRGGKSSVSGNVIIALKTNELAKFTTARVFP